MAAIVPVRICGYFLCILCKMAAEESLTWFILSIPIQMSTSIHLHYCFRKLNSYSVRLNDTNVLPEFESK